MPTDSRTAPRPVCVISSSCLAGRFLCSVLGNHAFAPVLAEDFSISASEPGTILFIVDCTFLTLPLSECINRLKTKFPSAYCIVVDKEQNDNDILYMLSLGIHGFVTEQQIEQELLRAANAVCSGDLWVSGKILQAYLGSYGSTRRPRTNDRHVATHRESQVLELIKRRLSNKEIAALLNVRESTVKYHVSNLFTKLHVTSRHELQTTDKVSQLGHIL